MRALPFLVLFLAFSCGDDSSVPGDGGSPNADDASETDRDAGEPRPDALTDANAAREDAGEETPSCMRDSGPDDFARKIVVAHPFFGSAGNVFEVLNLSVDGEVSETGVTFTMGRAPLGEIVFTPDGLVGFAVQDDGTIGTFRFDAGGEVEVLDPAFSGDFYATDAVMDPRGDALWIVDSQWEANGGGVFRAPIGCDDDRLDTAERVLPAHLPYALTFMTETRAFLLASATDAEPNDPDAHFFDFADEPPTEIISTNVFGDEYPIGGSSALTHDQQYVLFGDVNSFSKSGGRVGIARMNGPSFTQADLFQIEDPLAIETSPHDDAAIVVSGFGDAVFVLDYDPDSAEDSAFSVRGELDYAGAAPELPGASAQIRRGSLEGRVLFPENTAIRMVQFEGNGVVTDLGAFDLGSGAETITGAFGVQP